MRGRVRVDPDFILLYDEICRLYKRGLLVPKLCLGTNIVKLRFICVKQSFRYRGFQAGAWEPEKMAKNKKLSKISIRDGFGRMDEKKEVNR